MNTNIKFGLKEKVTIPDLSRNGYVTAINISINGTRYNVEYIDNGEKKSAYFLSEELGKEKNSSMGFVRS